MKELLLRFLPLVLGVISPEIRKNLEIWLNNLEAEAKKTANEWDDYFVAALKIVLLGK